MRILNRLIFLRPYRFGVRLNHRGKGVCTFIVLLMTFSQLGPPSFAKNKPKEDKFTGIVVNAGPKAITVKSKDNIYLLRTFNYTPPVEAKVKKKPLPPGKKVTVHYFRGSDSATKID